MNEVLVIRVSGPWMLARDVEGFVHKWLREFALEDVKKLAARLEKEWAHRRLRITFKVEAEP